MAKQKSAGGGSGGSNQQIPASAKVSKVMLWPSRKINLGNYSTVDVSAGMEITFDPPVNFGGSEIEQACEQVREFIGKEFRKQVNAFGEKKKGGEPVK